MLIEEKDTRNILATNARETILTHNTIESAIEKFTKILDV